MTHTDILTADSQAAAFAALRGIHSETEWLTAFSAFPDDLIAGFLRLHWQERVINRATGSTRYSRPLDGGAANVVLEDDPNGGTVLTLQTEREAVIAKGNMMAGRNQLLFTSRTHT